MARNKKKIGQWFVSVFILITLILSMAFPVLADKQYTYSADPSSGKTWVQVDSTTWTMDLNGDGKSDVTLKTSKNGQGDDVWTYTFNVEDDNQNYYVFEKMLNGGKALNNVPLKNGYTSKGGNNESGPEAVEADPGKIEGDDPTHSYTITNSKSHSAAAEETYGNLKISKQVTGTQIDPDQSFNFTVQLSSDDKAMASKYAGSKIFGDTPFMDGKAVISLKNGGDKTITGIPTGLYYQVTEEKSDGYSLASCTGDIGVIEQGKTQEAVFTNTSTYLPPAKSDQRYVNLHLVKKTTGATALTDLSDPTYNFHIVFAGLQPDKEISYIIQNAGADAITLPADKQHISKKPDMDGNLDIGISLKKDQECVFENILVGATYQIMEEGGHYIPSYTITSDQQGNAQIVKSNDAGTEDQSLATAKETADDSENLTVTFTNSYSTVQNLTIRKFYAKKIDGTVVTSDKTTDAYKSLSKENKELIDNGAAQKYSFTVDFSDLPEETDISSEIGTIKPDEFGEASKTFTLMADGTEMVFHNVPAGARYRVSEENGTMDPSYQIITTDSSGNQISGNVTNKEGLTRSTEEEMIEAGQSDTVTFTNADPLSINFGIIKVDQNNNVPVADAQYKLSKCDNGSMKEIGCSTTDNAGFAGWRALNTGVYVLQEIQAPNGYEKNDDIIFVLRPDKTVRYATSKDSENEAKSVEKYTDRKINRMMLWDTYNSSYNDQNAGATFQTYKVEEHKIVKLPITGGGGIMKEIAAASIIFILGMGFYIIGTRGKNA